LINEYSKIYKPARCGNNHFANRAALAQFWALPAAHRQVIWGNPIDPMDAIADFDPTYIHDSDLGAS
jgi:hypothetical protein